MSVVLMGCSKNTVDAEVFMGHLEATGRYRHVPDPRKADCVVINTCGFVEDAKRESIDAILDAAALRDDADAVGGTAVVVTGCLAQRYAGEIAEAMPEVRALLRP